MDSFNTKSVIQIKGQDFQLYDLNLLNNNDKLKKLPFSLKILLENLLRNEDGASVDAQQIESLLNWNPKQSSEQEIGFSPARVILQDFTGVPAVVDLACMRDAMFKIGGNPESINPLNPVELVIDHSVMVDHYGYPLAINDNVDKDYERNGERYEFLNWGQKAFKNFRVVPPNTGIVHQVNLEYLSRVIFAAKQDENQFLLYPDTIVGTDSHTTMVNGLGVLGWGVGGIEAEAAMLGQPVTMLIPDVVGFKLTGKLQSGVTATDLVLVVTAMLRRQGVVGKFVEFFGPGLSSLSLADRATIANMAPEYGATCGIFPYDAETIKYMELTGRSQEQCLILEAYARHQGLFHDHNTPEAEYSSILELDLSSIEPCIAGPKRPQDKINLKDSKKSYQQSLKEWIDSGKKDYVDGVSIDLDGHKIVLNHGAVVIAAITSCTNTSNPSVMIAAGLLAKAAVEKGLSVPSWVKTSLAPGSQVVTEYLKQTQLLESLEKLKFNIVGYGCTTCIGNSGPLHPLLSQTITQEQLLSCAVLSGNRNFEGRIHPDVRNSYLASPPLVVAYALAGTMNIDFEKDPIGYSQKNEPVYLKDIWPSNEEIARLTTQALTKSIFQKKYQNVFAGDERWNAVNVEKTALFSWNHDSTYIKNPPYFDGFSLKPAPYSHTKNARVLAVFGDSITTDHISPAGDIAQSSPAGVYLIDKKVKKEEFNSYGSRRGNHEVMMRGTFANIRLKNNLVKGKEGWFTLYHPDGAVLSIFDASMKYQADRTPLIILAGKEYGTGSSRDWAAKGTRLLGVKAVIAESYERIHRSNLIGMGVLPLQFLPGDTIASLGLDGSEFFDIQIDELKAKKKAKIIYKKDQKEGSFEVIIRLDTPKEVEYIENDGILPYVVRQLHAKNS